MRCLVSAPENVCCFICTLSCAPQNVRCLENAEWTRGQRGEVEQSIGRRRELTVAHEPRTCCSYSIFPSSQSVGKFQSGEELCDAAAKLRWTIFLHSLCTDSRCFGFIRGVFVVILSGTREGGIDETKRRYPTKCTRSAQPAGLLGWRLVRYNSVLQYTPRSSTASAQHDTCSRWCALAFDV